MKNSRLVLSFSTNVMPPRDRAVFLTAALLAADEYEYWVLLSYQILDIGPHFVKNSSMAED